MHRYCVDTKALPYSGDHVVHDLDKPCDHLATTADRLFLGRFPDCHGAVAEAKKIGYRQVIDCFYCCPTCHIK